MMGSLPGLLCWPFGSFALWSPWLTRGPRAQEKRKSGPGSRPVYHRFGPQGQVKKDSPLPWPFLQAPKVMGHKPAREVSLIAAVLNFWVGGGDLGWISLSWELDSSVKWWASVERFSRGNSQPRIYCVYFPAVSEIPFRMLQDFLLLDFSWTHTWPSPFLLALKTAGSLDSWFCIHL